MIAIQCYLYCTVLATLLSDAFTSSESRMIMHLYFRQLNELSDIKAFRNGRKTSPPVKKIVRPVVLPGKYESHNQILLPKDIFSIHFSYQEKPTDEVKKHTDKIDDLPT